MGHKPRRHIVQTGPNRTWTSSLHKTFAYSCSRRVPPPSQPLKYFTSFPTDVGSPRNLPGFVPGRSFDEIYDAV